MPEFLTISEVCDLLRLSERTVYTMCRAKRLPGAVKIGNQWRVDRNKLIASLKEDETEAKGGKRGG